jgi:uncharacterized protein (TIGR02145 family)
LSGCKKNEKTTIETGTVTDVDCNVYKTVKIGDHWWMAENLKTKRYRNGDSIVYVSQVNYHLDSVTWNHLDSGAYCIIDNSSETSPNYQGKMFGFLYNWYAVNDARNIAPEGWHVPSDAEWKELEIYLGMDTGEADKMSWRGTDQGNKLKIDGGSKGWNQPTDIYSVWGTNESGFTATGGGCCMYNGIWGNPGTFSTGFWWTSSTNIDKPLYRYLDYNKPNVFRYYGPKTYGFSIRCIKD